MRMAERPVPYKTRQAVSERAGGRCEACGNTVSLELHHLHYHSVGNENPDDLLALCRFCHQAQHVDEYGIFWADPEDRAAYEEAMAKD